jgi:hypothetical protein
MNREVIPGYHGISSEIQLCVGFSTHVIRNVGVSAPTRLGRVRNKNGAPSYAESEEPNASSVTFCRRLDRARDATS